MESRFLISPLVTQVDRPDREPPVPGEQPRGERALRRGPEELVSRLPVMKILDANGDHTLTGDEIRKAAEKLAVLDKSKDGKLSIKQARPWVFTE